MARIFSVKTEPHLAKDVAGIGRTYDNISDEELEGSYMKDPSNTTKNSAVPYSVLFQDRDVINAIKSRAGGVNYHEIFNFSDFDDYDNSDDDKQNNDPRVKFHGTRDMPLVRHKKGTVEFDTYIVDSEVEERAANLYGEVKTTQKEMKELGIDFETRW